MKTCFLQKNYKSLAKATYRASSSSNLASTSCTHCCFVELLFDLVELLRDGGVFFGGIGWWSGFSRWQLGVGRSKLALTRLSAGLLGHISILVVITTIPAST